MMRIKTYTSESVPEALKMIKDELGPGAVILKTNRKVKKRLWGLLPSMAYEITAASDPNGPDGEAPAVLGDGNGPSVPQALNADKADEVRRSLETYEVANTPPRPKAARGAAEEATIDPAVLRTRPEKKWQEQFDRLSDEIQSVIRLVSHQRAHDAISSLFLRDSGIASELQELIWQGDDLDLEWRTSAFNEFHGLIREGIEESLAFLLIRDIVRNCPTDEDFEDRLRIRLNKAVARLFQTSPIDTERLPRSCIFIGPTGVGKTTTIAKLAARFALRDRKRVKLLTFDTYRVAAAEQLKTYGDIIGIPVKVVFSLDELSKEVSKARSDEILLIDTTGHSHKRISDYGELSSFVRDEEKIEKHLVLSCTTRQEDLREIVACFGVFKPDRIVFTKLDEASNFGVILNESVRTNRPVSYLTNGQDVAEDLIVPTPASLADLLVPLGRAGGTW